MNRVDAIIFGLLVCVLAYNVLWPAGGRDSLDELVEQNTAVSVEPRADAETPFAGWDCDRCVIIRTPHGADLVRCPVHVDPVSADLERRAMA